MVTRDTDVCVCDLVLLYFHTGTFICLQYKYCTYTGTTGTVLYCIMIQLHVDVQVQVSVIYLITALIIVLRWDRVCLIESAVELDVMTDLMNFRLSYIS